MLYILIYLSFRVVDLLNDFDHNYYASLSTPPHNHCLIHVTCSLLFLVWGKFGELNIIIIIIINFHIPIIMLYGICYNYDILLTAKQ